MRIAQTGAFVSETPGTAAPLTAKLARSVSLSPQEMAVLAELQVPMRPVRRHREIITEGRKYAEIYVLLEGIAIRYRVSHDGRRQRRGSECRSRTSRAASRSGTSAGWTMTLSRRPSVWHGAVSWPVPRPIVRNSKPLGSPRRPAPSR
jgi:hypothetical protein